MGTPSSSAAVVASSAVAHDEHHRELDPAASRPQNGSMSSMTKLRLLPHSRPSRTTRLILALIGLCLLGLTSPRQTAAARVYKTASPHQATLWAECPNAVELSPSSLPASVPTLSPTYAAPGPRRGVPGAGPAGTPSWARSLRRPRMLLAFSWHRLGRILDPLVDLVPGGGIGRSLVRNMVAAVPSSRGGPSPPSNASEVVSVEEKANERRRDFEAALEELHRQTESGLQDVQSLVADNADELSDVLSEELTQLQDLGSTTLQAIRNAENSLANIDRNLVDVGQYLRDIESNLQSVHQDMIGFRDELATRLDRSDLIQQQIATRMRSVINGMNAQLDLARASNRQMSTLQANLDTYARTILLASGANAILLVLLLAFVLKIERNTRYAIDLMKVMLAEFNIPIPDPPLGSLGRLRSRCSDSRLWRWLPPTAGLAGRTLVSAVIVMAALTIVGPEYDEAQLAAWPAIGLGTAALLLARNRVPASDRLGQPVLALIPADVGKAAGLHRILVRDNGLHPADGGFVLGRHASLVDAVVVNPSVSRRHARIFRDKGVFYVEDLNSSNGTQVNGAKLGPFARKSLAVEDEVLFGEVKLSVESVG